MTEGKIMQLIVFALLLMSLGKNADLREIKPILESFGGEGVTDAIRQAEELNSVISAVQSFTSSAKSANEEGGGDAFTRPTGAIRTDTARGDMVSNAVAPLSPVSRIADEDILHCLSRYIALGE